MRRGRVKRNTYMCQWGFCPQAMNTPCCDLEMRWTVIEQQQRWNSRFQVAWQAGEVCHFRTGEHVCLRTHKRMIQTSCGSAILPIDIVLPDKLVIIARRHVRIVGIGRCSPTRIVGGLSEKECFCISISDSRHPENFAAWQREERCPVEPACRLIRLWIFGALQFAPQMVRFSRKSASR
jgi:hypothetical protein